MLKRSISGLVYVLICLGFFFLRPIEYKIFDIFALFVIICGTFELARALKNHLLNGWFVISLIYAVFFIPNYYFTELVLVSGYGWLFSMAFAILMVLVTLVYSLIVKVGIKRFFANALLFVYPALLIFTTVLANWLPDDKGFVSLVLIFAIAPLTDTLAYLVGMTYNKIRKGNARKMCPNLSPKKTWAGAIGGLVGGAIASILVYFIFKPSLAINHPVMFFIIIGAIGSILTVIGDLFESFIKRKVGLKDMGKIMPGHGGVLDRVDGMMFVSVFIFIVFLII